MDERGKTLLCAASIIPLLLLTFFTGGMASPFRHLYYPLIVLLSLRLSRSELLRAGFFFCVIYLFMVFREIPPRDSLLQIFFDAVNFFIITATAGYVASILRRETKRAENATATFNGLSEDLKNKTMNLQTALDALSEAHKRLQEVDREKTRFIGNVSHEMRTPLSSICSYSEILLNYDDIDDETRREFIRIIKTESDRLTRLVSENLDLVRIESGKFEPKLSVVDPAALLEGSVQVVMPMAREKKLSLLMDVPEGVTAVRGDVHQLTQVLVNLLNNAVKFTAEGSITAGVRPGEEAAEFFVADTGEGIFPEEREVIFDEYYRISDSVPTRPRGSGLGLSISKKIVEFHGGRIWVESAPGKGSTFYFTVPLAGLPAETSAEVAPHAAEEILGGYGPILVMSENIAIRHSLRKRLEELGYQTMGADTPRRGVEIAMANRPGLIIADVAGKCDDLATLESWVRSTGVPVLMTSLLINHQSGDLRLASSGYLSKPFDRFEVMSVLEQLQKHKGRVILISPDQEEARNLEVLLGAEGYGVRLFADKTEALRACRDFPPDCIIVGSFSRERCEELLAGVRLVHETADVPCFLVLDTVPGRNIKLLTIDARSRKDGAEGLYPLIMEVEKTYAHKWGEGRSGRGTTY